MKILKMKQRGVLAWKLKKMLDELYTVNRFLMDSWMYLHEILETADSSMFRDIKVLASEIDCSGKLCNGLIQKLEQAKQKKGVMQDE